MASELCMNCFGVKGQYEICPHCGYAEGTPPGQPHYLAPGTILANHFILGTVISAGGFGITYKCYDTTLGVIVAVKEFFPVGLVNRAPGEKSVSLLSGEKKEQYQKQIRRFLMEAQSIVQFGKAKDIVNVYDFFEENNTAYIIMEYVDGVLLKDYLEKQGKMEVAAALMIIESVAEAVKKIHAKGIIHRDISPDNIFLTGGQEAVKIFDFGAALFKDEGTAGEKVIKAGYSAPEQYRDNSRQSFYTDIYSIGAIFYQMVTGTKPPESTEREFKDELASPLALGVELDANLDRAVMEALAVQPELRFQNVQQFDEAIHGKRIAEYPSEKLKKRRRKRNMMAGVSALAILAVVVGVALISTVYKPGNIMFDTRVKEDAVTVWVDSAAAYTTFSELVDEEGSLNKIQPQDSDAVVQMKKENQSVTYDVWNVTVEDENHKKAYASMDEALAAVKDDKEQFPDVFMTDNVSDLSQYDLISYEDNVYRSIAGEKYLYLAGYQENMWGMREMPTSIDVLLLYAIDTGSDNTEITTRQTEAFEKQKIYSSTLVRGEYTDTIPWEDILAANDSGEEYTYMDTKSAVLLSILDDTEGFDWKKGEFTFDGGLTKSLDACLNMRSEAMKKAKWKTSGKSELHYGNSILAGAGYRSVLNNEKIGNVAVPYQVFVPTVDGKMLVQYSGKLAISDSADENRRIAAMRFVYFAMGQQQSAADKDMGFPVSDVDYQRGNSGEKSSAFREFFESNPRQKTVRDLIEEQSYPCMLLARGTGNITEFARGIDEKKVSGTAGLEDYCKSYEKDRKKKQ